MADKESLVPVFIPPLANMLAQAEKVKGKPLSETEVVRLRDKAPCIMMERADADAMTAKRGFIDVNPETCWSDWHRLRVEMTGNGFLPKIVLCVLGDADFADKAAPILQEAGVDHELQEPDERMAVAFPASASPVAPSVTEADSAAIRGHASVLYMLSNNYTAQQAADVSATMLRLGQRLLEVGGLAMKCESSGIAHGRARWIELAEQTADSTPMDFWSALFAAYVQMPIRDGAELFTCGMHLLGKPDMIVAESALRKPQVGEATGLFEGFGLYLLAECAAGAFGSGHTFSLHADAPKFRVLWEKCVGYDEDDFFFNPFGRWRFVGA